MVENQPAEDQLSFNFFIAKILGGLKGRAVKNVSLKLLYDDHLIAMNGAHRLWRNCRFRGQKFARFVAIVTVILKIGIVLAQGILQALENAHSRARNSANVLIFNVIALSFLCRAAL